MLELCVRREGQNSLPHKSRFSRTLRKRKGKKREGTLLDSYRPDLSFSSSVYSFFALFSLYQTIFELWQRNYIYIYNITMLVSIFIF